MDDVSLGNRPRFRLVLGLSLLTGIAAFAASPAWATNCPGNPDAIGTSRTLVVDPREHPRVGTMQYTETLPLDDHEVVLTFDDGPLPHNSNQILAILASQCVKATFFTIGSMARAFPDGVRRLRDAGHTIGTHTQTHPLTMNRMPVERAEGEIEGGIAATAAALGDPAAVAPFFRIPGLLRAEPVEGYLAARGIQTWSADFPADDWRHISAGRVHDLAMARIEAKGKGILLLHDIQARTVAALPRILSDLKARGYRIVHVVPATPALPPTPTEPGQWQLHPISESAAIARWPKIPNFVFASAPMLPAPGASGSDLHDGSLTAESIGRAKPAAGAAPQWLWPRPLPIQNAASATLPVPAQNIFQIPEKASVKTLLPLAHRADQTAAPAGSASDGIARLIAIDAGTATRAIPGSVPVTRPGLQPGPIMAR